MVNTSKRVSKIAASPRKLSYFFGIGAVIVAIGLAAPAPHDIVPESLSEPNVEHVGIHELYNAQHAISQSLLQSTLSVVPKPKEAIVPAKTTPRKQHVPGKMRKDQLLEQAGRKVAEETKRAAEDLIAKGKSLVAEGKRLLGVSRATKQTATGNMKPAANAKAVEKAKPQVMAEEKGILDAVDAVTTNTKAKPVKASGAVKKDKATQKADAEAEDLGTKAKKAQVVGKTAKASEKKADTTAEVAANKQKKAEAEAEAAKAEMKAAHKATVTAKALQRKAKIKAEVKAVEQTKAEAKAKVTTDKADAQTKAAAEAVKEADTAKQKAADKAMEAQKDAQEKAAAEKTSINKAADAKRKADSSKRRAFVAKHQAGSAKHKADNVKRQAE